MPLTVDLKLDAWAKAYYIMPSFWTPSDERTLGKVVAGAEPYIRGRQAHVDVYVAENGEVKVFLNGKLQSIGKNGPIKIKGGHLGLYCADNMKGLRLSEDNIEWRLWNKRTP